MAACQYQSRGYEENGAGILTEVQGTSLGDYGHKVKQGKSVLRKEMLACDDSSK